MIQSNQINVRFSTQLVLRAGDIEKGIKAITLNYEIFAGLATDAILETGSFSMPAVAIGAEMVSVDASLQNKALGRLADVQSHHAPISAIDGFSLYDANLILDGWQFYGGGGEWNATHPVSGAFSGALEPTLTNRINALLALVLPPPAWAWVDSVTAGAIRTMCVEVPGADHYAVYDVSSGNPVPLGDVQDHTLQTLAVSAGSYQIKVAPVAASGRVGVMSQAIPVTVG